MVSILPLVSKKHITFPSVKRIESFIGSFIFGSYLGLDKARIRSKLNLFRARIRSRLQTFSSSYNIINYKNCISPLKKSNDKPFSTVHESKSLGVVISEITLHRSLCCTDEPEGGLSRRPLIPHLDAPFVFAQPRLRIDPQERVLRSPLIRSFP